jgi:hypothetical protein
MQGQSYRKNIQDDDNDDVRRKKPKRKRGRNRHTEFGWVTVNTNYWQQWIHNCLYRRKPGTRLSIAIPEACAKDQDLIEQLMNEYPDLGISQASPNDNKITWKVVNEETPWDFRDCFRYARCAAEVYLRGNWARIPKQRRWSAQSVKSQANATKMPAESRPAADNSGKIPKKQNWVGKLRNSRLRRSKT